MARRIAFDWRYQFVTYPKGNPVVWAAMMAPLFSLPWPFKWVPRGGIGPLRWCITNG